MLQLGHVLNDLDGTMYTGGACPRSDNVVLRRGFGCFSRIINSVVSEGPESNHSDS